MAEVPLSRGKIAIVDGSDFQLISPFTWSAQRGTGLHRDCWYATTKIADKVIKMHRFLINAPDGLLVDHIDGDGLNNRRSNLRIATAAQNRWNQRSVRGASRFKGVARSTGGKPWTAQLTVNRKRMHLGTFSTEIEAALAYDRAALEHCGEFACTNAMLGLY